jgi:RNA polymerase sigma-70 factor (ECF subfamily)
MGEQLPDAVLWLEATSGTEASFAVLFDRHRVRVFRKAYSRVRNVTDAEDIVAMVFLEAWRSRRKVRIVDGSLLPWLLTVTTNVTLNVERTARRYRRLLAKLPPPANQEDHAREVADRLDNRESFATIDFAIQRLSRVERVIVDLCIVEELPLSTAASVLSIPVGTVKSRLHRARNKLRTYLGEPGITSTFADSSAKEGRA